MACFLNDLKKFTSNVNEQPRENIEKEETKKIDTSNPKKIEKEEKIRLTRYASALGCGCKMKPKSLETVLQMVHSEFSKKKNDPNLLLGNSTSDDASVYKLTEDIAIVQTTDFFPPIVDDPKLYGKIATANALSDIYAMNAKPITALSIVGFPSDKLPLEVLADILKGSEEICQNANVSITGGHSIDDLEPKFGLAVTGLVHPDKFLRNNTIEDEQILILTKKLGTGIVTTSIKKDLIVEDPNNDFEKQKDEAIESMCELNAVASEAINKINEKYGKKMVSACTDVTGFGLAGHLNEMTNCEEKIEYLRCAFVDIEKLSIFNSAKRLIEENSIEAMPGGTFTNASHVGKKIRWISNQKTLKAFISDPQTSGGLLISVNPEVANEIMDLLPVQSRIIGKIKFVKRNPEINKNFDENYRNVMFFYENKEKIEEEKKIESILNSNWYEKKYDFTLDEFIQDLKKETVQKPVEKKGEHAITEKVFLLKSHKMGDEPTLGKKLLLGFFASLLTGTEFPKKIIFVSSAINLTTQMGEGSDPKFIQLFKQIEEKGTEIVSCETCLDHNLIKEYLKVGRIGTAKENALTFMSNDIVTIC